MIDPNARRVIAPTDDHLEHLLFVLGSHQELMEQLVRTLWHHLPLSSQRLVCERYGLPAVVSRPGDERPA